MQERGVAQSDFKRLKSIECALHAVLGSVDKVPYPQTD